jgi:hypothetical protein
MCASLGLIPSTVKRKKEKEKKKRRKIMWLIIKNCNDLK